MNLRIITQNHAADPEIGFLTKSFSKPKLWLCNDHADSVRVNFRCGHIFSQRKGIKTWFHKCTFMKIGNTHNIDIQYMIYCVGPKDACLKWLRLIKRIPHFSSVVSLQLSDNIIIREHLAFYSYSTSRSQKKNDRTLLITNDFYFLTPTLSKWPLRAHAAMNSLLWEICIEFSRKSMTRTLLNFSEAQSNDPESVEVN